MDTLAPFKLISSTPKKQFSSVPNQIRPHFLSNSTQPGSKPLKVKGETAHGKYSVHSTPLQSFVCVETKTAADKLSVVLMVLRFSN